MRRSTVITIALATGFGGLLLYNTLGAQQVECTACGTLTQGMDESIRCAGLPPQRPQCRTR